MSVITHITHLQERHSKLEKAIYDEQHRPLPDFSNIAQLKKQKLLVKEELHRLTMANVA